MKIFLLIMFALMFQASSYAQDANAVLSPKEQLTKDFYNGQELTQTEMSKFAGYHIGQCFSSDDVNGRSIDQMLYIEDKTYVEERGPDFPSLTHYNFIIGREFATVNRFVTDRATAKQAWDERVDWVQKNLEREYVHEVTWGPGGLAKWIEQTDFSCRFVNGCFAKNTTYGAVRKFKDRIIYIQYDDYVIRNRNIIFEACYFWKKF